MNREYEIIWSPQAEVSYLKIIKFLLKKWTLKEALSFEKKTESYLISLKRNPRMCMASGKQKDIRRCIITPQTSLAYRVVKTLLN